MLVEERDKAQKELEEYRSQLETTNNNKLDNLARSVDSQASKRRSFGVARGARVVLDRIRQECDEIDEQYTNTDEKTDRTRSSSVDHSFYQSLIVSLLRTIAHDHPSNFEKVASRLGFNKLSSNTVRKDEDSAELKGGVAGSSQGEKQPEEQKNSVDVPSSRAEAECEELVYDAMRCACLAVKLELASRGESVDFLAEDVIEEAVSVWKTSRAQANGQKITLIGALTEAIEKCSSHDLRIKLESAVLCQ